MLAASPAQSREHPIDPLLIRTQHLIHLTCCLCLQSQGPNHRALADLKEASVLEHRAILLRAGAFSHLNPVVVAGVGRARAHVNSTALDLRVSLFALIEWGIVWISSWL